MPHDKNDDQIVEWAGSPEVSIVKQETTEDSGQKWTAWLWEHFFCLLHDPSSTWECWAWRRFSCRQWRIVQRVARPAHFNRLLKAVEDRQCAPVLQNDIPKHGLVPAARRIRGDVGRVQSGDDPVYAPVDLAHPLPDGHSHLIRIGERVSRPVAALTAYVVRIVAPYDPVARIQENRVRRGHLPSFTVFSHGNFCACFAIFISF